MRRHPFFATRHKVTTVHKESWWNFVTSGLVASSLKKITIKGLYSDSITLFLINENNVDEVRSMFRGFDDSEEMIRELDDNYLPEYEKGERVKYGFYTLLDNELAGMSLLGIDSFKEQKGYTGADTFLHMRGKGVAPRSKPHLFYFGFELLGLHRLATGCLFRIWLKTFHRKNSGFYF